MNAWKMGEKMGENMIEPKFTKGPLTIRESRDGYIIDASDVCALAEVYGHDE